MTWENSVRRENSQYNKCGGDPRHVTKFSECKGYRERILKNLHTKLKEGGKRQEGRRVRLTPNLLWLMSSKRWKKMISTYNPIGIQNITQVCGQNIVSDMEYLRKLTFIHS